MNLLPSLIYIKEHLSNYLHASHYFEENSDYILQNEIQRVIDSKDKYSIKSLLSIVGEGIIQYASEYYRHNIKHSENSNNFTLSDFTQETNKNFWILFKNIENLQV